MIFWGLKFLILGLFGVVKYGKYCLGWLELSIGIFLATQNALNFVIVPTNLGFQTFFPFWRLLRHRNSEWDFFGVNFWSRDVLAVLLGALGIFLGFDFWPYLIIPVTSNPETPWAMADRNL